jgi:hypothetical protein
LLSVNTSSVARAYFLPFLGVDGAGDGGKSCPSRSKCATVLLRTLVPAVEALEPSMADDEAVDEDGEDIAGLFAERRS